MEPRAPSVHPQQALAVYVESLAAGRRVVVFGDPSLGIGERLEELGARTVVVAGPESDLDELRGASFDVALVADLGLFDDPPGLLARVRRLVGEAGVALVAAANRDAAEADGPRAFDYYALFDLVAKEFADVRMIAQLPFQGVALAELGDEDDSPAVSVDTQLADPDRAPQAFIALASQHGASLEPYAIVELPALPAAPAVDTGELEAALEALAHERLRGAALEAQLEVLRGKASRVAELERDVASLEAEVLVRARQLSELSSEVEEMRSAAEAGSIAAAEIEELALRAERAERALTLVEPELSRVVDSHAAEMAHFEQALRERAQAIRLLEAEVARRERMVRELVDALDEQANLPPPVAAAPRSVEAAPAPAGSVDTGADVLADENTRLRERLDALALDLARREGEAQASAWAVAELERRVPAATPPAAGGPPEDSPALAAALDELDALRRALSQEHEARMRAESGEELARARAEIRRQAVLLEQLGREVGREVGPASTSGKELR